ncbi:MAG: aspartate aminotransferase family protein [Caldiserica bacterium]|nr:aspartate aminotransferase family protein [Caldisericota bacterium]
MKSSAEFKELYAARTPTSRKLSERARRLLPAGVVANVKYFAPYPLFMRRAGGSHLWDVDGNEYIDYCLAFGPLILGHGDPAVVSAVAASFATWGTTIFGTPNELEIQYAEKLMSMLPIAGKVRLTNSGSEATYLALQLGRAATGKPVIARFEGHYHGWHYEGVLSNSPRAADYGDPERPTSVSGSRGTPASILENTLVLPFNDLDACRTLLTANRDRVGTVILEPSPRAFYQTDPGFLAGLRALTRELGMVLIFDEVMSGFRSGPRGATGVFGVAPDLMTLGKIIGGGFPIGAVAGREDLLDLTSPLSVGGSVFHSGTFNGAVQVLAAGLATLHILSDESQTRPFYEATEEFKASIRQLLKAHHIPGHVAGLGANFGVIMSETPIRNYRDLARENGALREAFDFACLTEGIYIHPHKPFYTSLAHSAQDYEVTLQKLDRIFVAIG